MFCSKCGNKCEPYQKFCRNCGSYLGKDKQKKAEINKKITKNIAIHVCSILFTLGLVSFAVCSFFSYYSSKANHIINQDEIVYYPALDETYYQIKKEVYAQANEILPQYIKNYKKQKFIVKYSDLPYKENLMNYSYQLYNEILK